MFFFSSPLSLNNPWARFSWLIVSRKTVGSRFIYHYEWMIIIGGIIFIAFLRTIMILCNELNPSGRTYIAVSRLFDHRHQPARISTHGCTVSSHISEHNYNRDHQVSSLAWVIDREIELNPRHVSRGSRIVNFYPTLAISGQSWIRGNPCTAAYRLYSKLKLT